jgi:adenylate cyclase
MCASLVLAVSLFSSHSMWLPAFLPLGVAAPAGILYAYALKLRDYRYDRNQLKQIVRKFVPQSVIETLVSNVKHLGAVRETMHAACVMTDVEGFTALSSKLAPGQVHGLLQEYFAAIFLSVADYGGFVSDLKGDSILAVWTDRDADRTVRKRVCHACLDLQDAVEQFNHTHPQSPMPTRIGVNYGLVSLGPVGAGEHYEYRAVGDTVNTASRVEQLSKDLGTYLLVTAPVLEGLDGFLVRDLGDFSLRGRRGPTRLFEVICASDVARPEQIALCAEFAKALQAYEGGQVEQAQARFQAVLLQFPADGPSAYYSRLTQRTG